MVTDCDKLTEWENLLYLCLFTFSFINNNYCVLKHYVSNIILVKTFSFFSPEQNTNLRVINLNDQVKLINYWVSYATYKTRVVRLHSLMTT